MPHSHSFWALLPDVPSTLNCSIQCKISTYLSDFHFHVTSVRMHYLKEWAKSCFLPSFLSSSLHLLCIGTFLQHLPHFAILCYLPWIFLFPTWSIFVSYLFICIPYKYVSNLLQFLAHLRCSENKIPQTYYLVLSSNSLLWSANCRKMTKTQYIMEVGNTTCETQITRVIFLHLSFTLLYSWSSPRLACHNLQWSVHIILEEVLKCGCLGHFVIAGTKHSTLTT